MGVELPTGLTSTISSNAREPDYASNSATNFACDISLSVNSAVFWEAFGETTRQLAARVDKL